MTARQIALDTETTGLDPQQGHRVIEIGCVELINRRLTGNTFHCYVNPEREVEEGALAVHGITNEFLADKPRFADITQAFLDFIFGAELIIHNAPFDVGFLQHELMSCGQGRVKIVKRCQILDTLPLARQMHPGQRNSLDALCKRYGVDNSHRELHGALLDAELLALLYLAMTGGQESLFSDGEKRKGGTPQQAIVNQALAQACDDLLVIKANDNELAAHQECVAALNKSSNGKCLFEN